MQTHNLTLVHDDDAPSIRTLAAEIAELRRSVEYLMRREAVGRASQSGAQPDTVDLLYGVEPIRAYICMTAAQVYHLHARGQLPTFKIGKKVCARRSDLDMWLAIRAASAVEARS